MADLPSERRADMAAVESDARALPRVTHRVYDEFIRERVPPTSEWPDILFDLPDLQYQESLNVAVELADKAVAERHGERIALLNDHVRWPYRDLAVLTINFGCVLVEHKRLQPGNRVLLRGANSAILFA